MLFFIMVYVIGVYFFYLMRHDGVEHDKETTFWLIVFITFWPLIMPWIIWRARCE